MFKLISLASSAPTDCIYIFTRTYVKLLYRIHVVQCMYHYFLSLYDLLKMQAAFWGGVEEARRTSSEVKRTRGK